MILKPFLLTAIILVFLQSCSSSSNSPRAVDAPPVINPGGEVATGAMKAQFDPANGIIPFPSNLLLSGTTDLTLNPPVENPADLSDPAVALSALDGFSTVAPWAVSFTENLASNTVSPATVKLYKVRLSGVGGAPIEVLDELIFGQDFVAVANENGLNIVPLKPLQELSSYLAVLVKGIADTNGNPATADTTYFIAKRTSPLVDINGNSTDPLLPNASAQALEPLRQLTNAQEAVAAGQGINPDDIILSWSMTTQSITPVLSAVKSITMPGDSMLVSTGLTTAAFPGGAGIADIYIGVMSSPYYLTAPNANNPVAPLSVPWKASAGAYIPPFDSLGLDPNSTNLTFANPIPVATSEQNLPVIMTIPNPNSGKEKPAAGWPILIFQHGITRNRTDALALADSMASAGFAVVAIDLPLHGVTDANNPFYIGGTPFSSVASERTFDMDLMSAAGAAGPDGEIDASGSHYINLSNLLVSRDNVRQGVADLLTLTETVPLMDIDGDNLGDFDASRIGFAGLSLGAMTGINYLALAPNVSNAILSAPGGGIAQLLVGSPTFGPRIIAGLEGNGIAFGSADFNRFFVIAQTVVDSADPINLGALAAANNSLVVHEILDDQVITNRVRSAPLSGTEPLIAVMGLPAISETVINSSGGVRGAVRFTEGDHGSLLNPTSSLAATVEMQTQLVGFNTSKGDALIVTNTDVIQQEQQP